MIYAKCSAVLEVHICYDNTIKIKLSWFQIKASNTIKIFFPGFTDFTAILFLFSWTVTVVIVRVNTVTAAYTPCVLKLSPHWPVVVQRSERQGKYSYSTVTGQKGRVNIQTDYSIFIDQLQCRGQKGRANTHILTSIWVIIWTSPHLLTNDNAYSYSYIPMT